MSPKIGHGFCSASIEQRIGRYRVDNVQQVAFTFVKVIMDLDLKGYIDVWETPAAFPIMPLFS